MSSADPVGIRPGVPAYGRAALSDLVPTLLRASAHASEPARMCLLLVDGLGVDVIAESQRADAPFLHERLPAARVLDAGFPASTPISLCSLGTGRTPGEHGIVGFTMHVPPVAAVMECLNWTSYAGSESLLRELPPETLQPIEPLIGGAGLLETTVVSLRDHLDSGLTRAAFRGARFSGIDTFEDTPARCRMIRDALERPRDPALPTLVYTYDPRLDTAAHVSGVGSPAWRSALRATDRLVRDVVAALPPGAVLHVTGDHGALNVPASTRIDLAELPRINDGIAWLSGDPRARHVHAVPGRAADVATALRDRLGEDWWVLSRDEAIDSGLFGPTVRDAVRPRIGDVVLAATGQGGIMDSSRYPWELGLVAFHGGLHPAEMRVPWFELSRDGDPVAIP